MAIVGLILRRHDWRGVFNLENRMPLKDRALQTLPIVAAAVPVIILFRMAIIGLYASPETDDFCLANHFNNDGLIGTVTFYYSNLIGRIVPIILITVPAMVSKAFDLDYFAVYPLLLIFGMVSFVALNTLCVGRLWTGLSAAERFFAGTALSAAIVVLAVSLWEMLFWLSGSAPYMIPAAMITIILIELVSSAANDARLSAAAITLLAALCFLGALCNEFTPLWIIAFVAGSFLFRKASSHPYPQPCFHAVLLAATLTGFAIVLSAPGNAVRMSQYPAGGKIALSFAMAMEYLVIEIENLCSENAARAWLATVAIFSVFVAPAHPPSTRKLPLLIVGLAVVILCSAYAAYYVAYFATAEDLATRGRNQVVVLLLVGLTCIVALTARALEPERILGKSTEWTRLTALILCGVICLLFFNGRALVAVKAERSQFSTFWLESMQRHMLLRSVSEKDVVVPNRTVKPSVLMSADLTQDPYRIPNDCVAIFYGKKTVIMQPGG